MAGWQDAPVISGGAGGMPAWMAAPVLAGGDPTVGDRAAQLAKATAAPTGAYNNATAGLNDLIYRTAGAPVDAANTILRGGAAALHAVGGPDIQLPVDTPGGHQSIADLAAKFGVNDPSKVVATSQGDRLARAAGEGVGMAVAPEAALAALGKLGIVGSAAQELLGMIVGRAETPAATAGNAAASGVSSVVAQGASDAAPDNLKPLAATVGGLTGAGAASAILAAPTLVKTGVGMARDFVAPMSQGGREQAAGQVLTNAADNPTAVKDAIANGAPLVPGSNPTTFQQTGDMGLGGLERSAATKSPADFNQRRADQNTARTAALEGVQATGAPEQVAAAVTSHINALDAQAQAATDAATNAAQAHQVALGAGQTPEAAGATMRTSLEASRAAAKTQERALWNAVDPEGTLALPVADVKSQVATTLEKLPASAKPPSGEEAAIYQTVNQYGDVLPFSELTALKSRVGAEMRAERMANGESPAWGRLSQVAEAISSDMEKAIASRVAEDNIAVASGQMAPADTTHARIQNWENDYRTAFEVQNGLAADARGNGVSLPGRGAPGVVRVSGATSQTGVGFGGAQSDPRLSGTGLNQNFDQGALDRLKAASAATSSRVSTFDNKTLGPLRARPSQNSPYDTPAAAVPAKIFFPGQNTADAIAKYRAAVGDQQALPIIEEYAVDRLRKAALRDDGTLDPNKLAQWRRAHSDALRSFPALDARLANAATASQTMGETVAAGKATLDAVQKDAIGKLLGLTNPDDVTRTIGSIFARQDAVKQMSLLRQAIGGDKQAIEGLRKSVVDYMVDNFVSNTEAATSGLGTIKSDQLQSFIAQNKSALKAAGFTEAELGLMDNIAADLQQANRSLAAVKLPGGSNTAQDTIAANAETPSTMLARIVITMGAGSVAGTVVGGPVGAVVGGVAAQMASMLRQDGLRKIDDLVKQALLDPQLARMLMMKVKPAQVKAATMTIGQRFRRSALIGVGSVNYH